MITYDNTDNLLYLVVIVSTPELFPEQLCQIKENSLPYSGELADLYFYIDNFPGCGMRLDVQNALFVSSEETSEEGVNNGKAVVFLLGQVDNGP
jgi:hypothetical protein